ncbi:unnamed protein product, partial [Ectocarpus sp. 12 AP-2014]
HPLRVCPTLAPSPGQGTIQHDTGTFSTNLDAVHAWLAAQRFSDHFLPATRILDLPAYICGPRFRAECAGRMYLRCGPHFMLMLKSTTLSVSNDAPTAQHCCCCCVVNEPMVTTHLTTT